MLRDRLSLATSLDRIACALERIVDHIDTQLSEERALKDETRQGLFRKPIHPSDSIHCQHCGVCLCVAVDTPSDAPTLQHFECEFCGKVSTIEVR